MFNLQVLLLALLSCGALTASFQIPLSRNIAKNAIKVRSASALLAKKEPIPENETESEQTERLKRRAKRMMFNENGVAYAPWMNKQIDEDAMVELLRQKEAPESSKKKKTSILDRGEIESSEGMRWRMAGNQVDLAWVTGGGTNNLGYIVEKRPSYGGDFQEIATFNEVSALASKGAGGGKYRYTDPSTAQGSWIYRVKDCDAAGVQNMLCQCFVEVTTDSETKSQALVAVGFVAFLVVSAVIGYSLDPPR
mmetsp:Transcript_21408/g.47870  ORF Transcript_21408/g.47870 Transcript_21408/m.47870 type:complete len:251 (+) Transcript_21408:112-864(+)